MAATPNIPNVQTENTVRPSEVDAATDQQDTADAARTDRRDDRQQQQAAPKAKPGHSTSELPQPGEPGQAVDTPPVNPDGRDDAPQGEKINAIPPSASPQTEQRIARDVATVERTGEVPPRSTLAPAKPARGPTEDEQRMAEDFDPPPLAHRPDVGQ
jgi:hypothetical protein